MRKKLSCNGCIHSNPPEKFQERVIIASEFCEKCIRNPIRKVRGATDKHKKEEK